VVDDGFWKRKKQREFITQCIDLYVNGMSLRKVKTHIEQFSETTISHTAISKWLKRYSVLVKGFTDSIPIQTSGIYHADEVCVKCDGELNYFFDLIDAETRFLVATFYDKEKGLHGAKELFNITKKRAEKPLSVYTDGLPAYVNVIPKTWYSLKSKKGEEVEHIRIIDKHDYRNNIIERVQGTLRERIKVMRGFKNPKSAEATLTLMAIWYNFIRIHQGIRMTPAERCGIKLNLGQNKWLGLIYKSALESACENK
jgi:transposase-like protein